MKIIKDFWVYLLFMGLCLATMERQKRTSRWRSSLSSPSSFIVFFVLNIKITLISFQENLRKRVIGSSKKKRRRMYWKKARLALAQSSLPQFLSRNPQATSNNSRRYSISLLICRRLFLCWFPSSSSSSVSIFFLFFGLLFSC